MNKFTQGVHEYIGKVNPSREELHEELDEVLMYLRQWDYVGRSEDGTFNVRTPLPKEHIMTTREEIEDGLKKAGHSKASADELIDDLLHTVYKMGVSTAESFGDPENWESHRLNPYSSNPFEPRK